METVAHWCSVDTRTGCLTCVLEENNCFDAEMYADELEIDEEIEFKEDQRSKLIQIGTHSLMLIEIVNLGKWILRYLFANLIDEEIRKDEVFRRRLFNAKYPHLVQDMERSKGPPGRLEIPQTSMTSWLDMSSAPTSASTLKPPNGIQYPQTPGLAIGLATPAVMTPGPPTTNGIPPVSKSTNLASSPHLSSSDENATLDRSSTRTSSERQSGDYFTARGVTEQQASTPGGQLSSQASPVLNGRSSSENTTLTALPPAASTESEPTTSSPEKTGLKKFMRMNLIPKSLKKSDKVNDAKVLATEEPQSDSDSRNSQADDRLNEDTLLGAIFRIRHNYELQSRSGGTEPETGVGLNIKSTLLSKEKETNSSPSLVSSAITPSLPNDTPVIKPPPQTIILIQDDNVESGGVADLWEGTVGTVGKDAEVVERVAPAWLADVLLRNTIPLKELVKVSFVLEPWQGLLPAVSTDGNTRLNANRMLRVRKILTYICDRIEPQSQDPDPDAMKPEEYLELYCHGQVCYPRPRSYIRLPSNKPLARPSDNDTGYYPHSCLAWRRRRSFIL
jgi:WD repeat-containing protein 48